MVEENTKSVDIIERDLNLALLTTENADAMLPQALAEPEPVTIAGTAGNMEQKR